MSMFNKFTNWVKDTSTSIKDEVQKYKSRDFLEATIAGCALVASADGTISPEEKRKMIGFIKQNDDLRVFNLEECIKIFENFTSKIDFDTEIGKGECLRTISKLKGKPEARLMVHVCCAIGASDGNFDPDEKRVVREICRELEIDYSDLGL